MVFFREFPRSSSAVIRTIQLRRSMTCEALKDFVTPGTAFQYFNQGFDTGALSPSLSLSLADLPDRSPDASLTSDSLVRHSRPLRRETFGAAEQIHFEPL